MSVTENKVPPVLRKWAVEHAIGVEKIERYSKENESVRRGWKVIAKSASTRRLPDGFDVTRVSNSVNGVRIQIREH